MNRQHREQPHLLSRLDESIRRLCLITVGEFRDLDAAMQEAVWTLLALCRERREVRPEWVPTDRNTAP